MEPSSVELSRRQLDVGRYRIGRSPECEIHVAMNGLSREHAVFDVLPNGGVVVEDLGSTNGTRVDGERISRIAIRHDAMVDVGLLRLRLTESDSAFDALGYRVESAAVPHADSAEVVHTPALDGTQMLTLRNRLRDAFWQSLASEAETFRQVCDAILSASRSILEVDALRIEQLDAGGERLILRALGDPSAAGQILAAHGRYRICGPAMPVNVDQHLVEMLTGLLAWLPEPKEPETVPASMPHSLPGVATADPILRRRLEALGRVARSRVAILLLGETGVGKDVLARWVHEVSPRRAGPFVAINCAALPRDLLEAELFGVEKGAATGVTARPGVFERAHGGTLFLDELGDMPMETQVRLLRALEDGRIHRVGGHELIEVDVRLLSATNRDLQLAVEEKQFRLDLYHRIAGFESVISPLRERRFDIAPLAIHFFHRALDNAGIHGKGITEAALQDLYHAEWRGNIRELRQAVESATALLANGETLDRQHLPPRLRGTADVDAGRAPLTFAREGQVESLADAVARAERVALEQAIDAAGGDPEIARGLLGIGKTTYYKKIKEHEITRESLSEDPRGKH
ncbi:sigma 54-interacting transcriptional regulator [Dokdonella sp.]|uniref:sigma 54-interacting transcriptional regulator n=1 Tax=Dokdonella sp. TaxID=2291710 RepID=UPI0035279B83